VALRAAEKIPDRMLVLPTIVHGYTAHVMDFPGTINIHWEHFIHMVLDVAKSLAYHGFKKMVLLNGHGSNMPNLDLVARRVNLETDAECILCAWWSLLTVDKKFLPGWRESEFPGGCSHACELETSAYLYLDEDNVRKDLVRDGRIAFNEAHSDFHWVDLFAAGPAPVISWTSTYSKTGVLGTASLGTREKGKQAVEEAAKQLARLVIEFGKHPKPKRTELHSQQPSMALPWDQQGPPDTKRRS
jgi:creatinine amidohydrolase